MSWRVFHIEKENHPGEYRRITAPNDELKAVQEDILHFLYKIHRVKYADNAHGFIPGRSCSTALAVHEYDADVYGHMDVRHFFDTFPPDAAYRGLLNSGVNDVLAEKIMKVCTYKGTIPQGGPCSPYLTNMGMLEADRKIAAYLARHDFKYTRYADDILITHKNKPDEKDKKWWFLVHGINAILKSTLNIRLNFNKCYFFYRKGNKPMQVLGQTIRKDGKGFDAHRSFRRDTRAAVYNLAKSIERHNGRPTGEDKQQFMVIKGRVAYMDYVRSYNKDDANTADPLVQEKYWDYILKAMEDGH